MASFGIIKNLLEVNGGGDAKNAPSSHVHPKKKLSFRSFSLPTIARTLSKKGPSLERKKSNNGTPLDGSEKCGDAHQPAPNTKRVFSRNQIDIFENSSNKFKLSKFEFETESSAFESECMTEFEELAAKHDPYIGNKYDYEMKIELYDESQMPENAIKINRLEMIVEIDDLVISHDKD